MSLVLYLNKEQKRHKYYEAITTVTHYFIPKFLYFKDFLLYMYPKK